LGQGIDCFVIHLVGFVLLPTFPYSNVGGLYVYMCNIQISKDPLPVSLLLLEISENILMISEE